MGQKINPGSLRLGIVRQWPSRWFPKGDVKKFLAQDEAIRNAIMKKAAPAGISAIEIERTINVVRVIIRAAKPGIIIGRGGKGIEDITKAIELKLRGLRTKGEKASSLSVNVEEVRRSDISAPYVAQQIAWDLEKRLPFRRTMKKYLEQILQNREAKGAKLFFSGRLDGAEIARREWLRKGELPLQTLRADIDYGTATAFTTYGTVGIKVWIYKGEVFGEQEEAPRREQHEPRGRGRMAR